jgi:hypothetical protein
VRPSKFGTWYEFFTTALLRGGFQTAGCLAGSCGFVLALFVVVGVGACIIMLAATYSRGSIGLTDVRDILADMLMIAGAAIAMGGLSYALVFGGRSILKVADDVPVVTPITRRNVGDMPPEISLVRASDRPATEDRTALVRAANAPGTAATVDALRPVDDDTPENNLANQATVQVY